MQRPSTGLNLIAIVLLLLLLALGCMHRFSRSPVPVVPADAVGRVAANRYHTPTGQILTPAGRQIELPGMRPQALALSPDGRFLVTSGKSNSVVLIDPAEGQILRVIPLSTTEAASKPESTPDQTNAASKSPTITAQISLTGLIFSHDSRRIYLSNPGGNIWMVPLNADGQPGQPIVLPVPAANAPKQKHEIPAGLALSADDTRLYVAGNLGNRLHELDASTGKLLRSWDTGVAPVDVALAGGKAYVANLGGRRPTAADRAAVAGKGTTVRVDPVRYIPNEGSVTVIELASGAAKAELLVGLHPSAFALSPDSGHLVVANTGSDTLSVIDTASDRVVERIWARQSPSDLFGAQPNALTFDPSGGHLYVCNGTQNAVAVIDFAPSANASKVIGLIPVGWFPGAVRYHPALHTLCVANIKGIGATKLVPRTAGIPVRSNSGSSPASPKLSTKDFYGTVSLVPEPSQRQLVTLTKTALRNIHAPKLTEAMLPPRPGQPSCPNPERVGEPSVFKHVVYVIKENRSYDQILGDMPEGNGDPSLCTFGELYTPNQHKLAREFVLLDNTYCSGVQSADGHQWTDSAIANEYVERQLTSGTPRSYPGGKTEDNIDALAWASSGFIWDNALAHGKTFRNYGEWMLSEAGWADPNGKGTIRWTDFWQDHQAGSGKLRLRSRAAIESLGAHSNTNTVGWDLRIPDLMRADEFIRELRQFETNGAFPNLIILFLPNDHSAGTSTQYPTPGAQIADNDLAFGRVVEALSHSRFWPETCLFAIEDDPQAGWDHVSGYRTTCYVVSPYTKRRQTISTQYNHTSLLRTIELILGLPPMNYLDAVATPMTDCFSATPNLTPFTSVPNRIPLDQMNPDPRKIANPLLRRDAVASARLPLHAPDLCSEDQLNRILWRAMKGPEAPYPEWAVKLVDDDDD
jgi:YVTN family beta-propeller protein